MSNYAPILCLLISFSLFSCTKENSSLPASNAISNGQSQSSKIKWSDLPDKYKNALSLKTDAEISKINSNRSSSDIVDTRGPYGAIKGTSFSIYPPTGGRITAIGLGGDPGINVRNITIWYKNAAGTLTRAQAGKTMDSDTIDFYELNDDEYINNFNVFTRTYLAGLTITTNKYNTVAAGVPTGVYAPPVIKPGFQVYGIWGYADNSRVYQVNFDIHCKPWQLISGSSGRDIAVAADGTSYLVNTSGKIYRMSPSATTWTQLAGSDASSIAANAGRVCMVNTAGKIYDYIGSSWRQLPGSDAIDIAINSNGDVWMVNTIGNVYKYNGSSWTFMFGTDALRIAANDGKVWIVNNDDEIYSWTISYGWSKMPGSDGKDIAIGSDGYSWLTNTSGLLYTTLDNRFWQEICGSSGRTISSNHNKVMMVNTSGKIYKLDY